ncbi:ATP-binding cassette domain-containing protein [Furfurilactobacillus siliginis]|uniref:ABC superfamily ATP binding cassette transporter, ABC protein n=1 Tax=Furfurilactobacillus siliginis TaxID=348151 RepID=A0A0R2L171_9LACO|nr:ABC transporter ATP-binding protein [Furfurilactobacillus siliginis]KRN95458.1 ABC superfamily ATP binding cassette transporter, ABC protein [Furfurilactobacillus siliginis]GEK28231.1 ABC transporter ATP-binding protein [Furfurilactobacillus siliginis]
MTLAVKHLSFNSGNKHILNNVNLEFEPGTIYGLLGRNGAGKSTLLNLISDRYPEKQGAVTIDGHTVHDHDAQLQQMYLMSEVNLYPDNFRVTKLFKLTQQLYGEFNWDLALRLAKQFGLETHARFGKLSTGYRTICKDIIALSVPADYILLDEPVLGLDANHRELFYQELMNAQAERPRTFVIATHLIEEVSWLLNHVMVLVDGHIKVDETLADLTEQAWQLTGPKEVMEPFINQQAVLHQHQFGNDITAVMMIAVADIPAEVTKQKINLQELFVALTEETHEN